MGGGWILDRWRGHSKGEGALKVCLNWDLTGNRCCGSRSLLSSMSSVGRRSGLGSPRPGFAPGVRDGERLRGLLSGLGSPV